MATPVDTATETVNVGRLTFKVTARHNDEHTPYELHGARGAWYGLMRNQRNPHHLFTFNMKGFTRHAPDWWFSDEGGELRWVR